MKEHLTFIQKRSGFGPTTRAVYALVAAWVIACGGGLLALAIYSSTPGRDAIAVRSWPTQSAIERSQTAHTLVLFLHPHCPCSRATVAELARGLASAPRDTRVVVSLFCPRNESESWTHSSLQQQAQAIPGVTTCPDFDGEEAKRFGASTSGHAMLFDKHGLLVFSGGITAARGHEGDNAGRATVAKLLQTGEPGLRETQVFGCPISSDCASAEEKPR
ncbi:MAG: hypothetical protein ACREJD_17915 [Phycisphaerales bacterium]